MNYSDLEKYQTLTRPSACIDCDMQPQVGWDITAAGNDKVAFLFSKKNLEYLSNTISEALQGVDPQNRKIIVPDDKICNILNTVYEKGTRPNIGDIHSRYIIEPIQTRNDIKDINNQTIGIIVSAIRDELETTENNKTLTVWNTLYGDFNPVGLRQHPIIKIRKRHPQYMAFNMNY